MLFLQLTNHDISQKIIFREETLLFLRLLGIETKTRRFRRRFLKLTHQGFDILIAISNFALLRLEPILKSQDLFIQVDESLLIVCLRRLYENFFGILQFLGQFAVFGLILGQLVELRFLSDQLFFKVSSLSAQAFNFR